MTKFTKADIDGLVDGLPNVFVDSNRCKHIMPYSVESAGLRSALYLAAGLTAEGEAKPEKVRCWLVTEGELRSLWLYAPRGPTGLEVIPGTFVPDGAA